MNACRKPGEWQTYDVIFEAPKWDTEGNLLKKAYITVLHNGVVTHHRQPYIGATGHKSVGNYNTVAEKGPIKLQDHGNPTRFRNILGARAEARRARVTSPPFGGLFREEESPPIQQPRDGRIKVRSCGVLLWEPRASPPDGRRGRLFGMAVLGVGILRMTILAVARVPRPSSW